MHGLSAWVESEWVWAKEHKELIARYSAVGVSAWVVSLCIQSAFVEVIGLSPTAAYPPQFILTLLAYYYLLRKFVWREDHFQWRDILHYLGGIKVMHAFAGFCVFQGFLLLGLAYPLALTVSSLMLGVPFFLITRDGAFKTPEVKEAEA